MMLTHCLCIKMDNGNGLLHLVFHHHQDTNMLRLHVTGGALRGGRVVDGEAAVAVLDTAAGVWLDRHGLVTSSHTSNVQTEDPSLELMRRCQHATSSVGSCVYVYGGLRGDLLLDDFVVAENCPFLDANNTSEKGSNMTTVRTHNLCLFDPISNDDGSDYMQDY